MRPTPRNTAPSRPANRPPPPPPQKGSRRGDSNDSDDDSSDSDSPLPPITFRWLTGYPRPKLNAATIFIDLPVELRVRVYELVFHGAEQHLAHFTDPPLVVAYPALRAEMLAEYLKSAKLIAIVRTNLKPEEEPSEVIVPNEFARAHFANDCDLPAGKLGLRRSLKTKLDASHGTMEPVMYHIDLRRYSYSTTLDVVEDVDPEDQHYDEVRLSTSDTPPSGRRYHYDSAVTLQRNGGYDRVFLDVWNDKIAVPVRALAWDIVKRPGFCGFTLKDIKELAREFRLNDSTWERQ
ncbi:hypothetical protein TI39_contig4106g00032 [Zymoseptoria brevis]|uniref:Uncharacterized protein n=1 Tax=Zymoseptoria brevis TaxID=1047168 RepID=A0A0F4GH50_9PEZI|nr:hypothetical protein TI39_contig4106g00032 [Zymoseptoria brevis]